MSYKARRRWSAIILLIGLPLYLLVAWAVLGRLPLWQLPTLVEFAIYIVVGVAWVFPLKPIFKGVGQPDPDAPEDDPY
ncbi:MAG: hypothetical protein CSA70_01325 [Rhodobacterales bacterium]|nr:MAG: hypothetical protein CSA70_01325 [Rhodobacterales bacterium]